MGSARAVACGTGVRLGAVFACPRCKQLQETSSQIKLQSSSPILKQLSEPSNSQARSCSGKFSPSYAQWSETPLRSQRLRQVSFQHIEGLRRSAFLLPRKGVRRSGRIHAAAGSTDGKDFYEILGVPQTADEREIKKAYRRMALKYHPDVNKEKDAQAVFVKIKQAYTTLSDSKSRSQYDAQLRGGSWGFPGGSPDWDPLDPFGYKKKRAKGGKQEEEEFYGFGDFFRDLQKEVEGWQKDREKDTAPKSLWEELSEVGEEFVEFLEQELGLDEKESKQRTERRKSSDGTSNSSRQDPPRKPEQRDGTKATDRVAAGKQEKQEQQKEEGADIEELLASLKKEMGL